MLTAQNGLFRRPAQAALMLLALAATPAQAEPAQADGDWSGPFSAGLPFPAEGTDPVRSAQATLAPCAAWALSQTWHISCVLRTVWGTGHNYRNPPPPHSAPFLRAALEEAGQQTRRFKTREHQVFRLAAQRLGTMTGQVSYVAFLEIAGEAFRQVPRPSPVTEARPDQPVVVASASPPRRGAAIAR